MPKCPSQPAKFGVKEHLKKWFEVVDFDTKTVRCKVEGCSRDSSKPFQFATSKGWYKFERHLTEVHKIAPALIRAKTSRPEEVIVNHFIPKSSKTTSKVCYDKKDSRQVQFEAALVDYITLDLVPLDTPTRRGFRNLIATIDPNLSIPCRRTITKKINDDAKKIKSTQKVLLSRVQDGNVHLSLDLWTSLANKSVFSMKAHFITEDWELKCITVCFKHFKYTKSGHNLRNFFKLCLSGELGLLPQQVGTIMADNASENVKAFDLNEFKVDTCETFDGDSDEDSSLEDQENTNDPAEYDLETPSEFTEEDVIETGEPVRTLEDEMGLNELITDWNRASFQRLGCTAHALQLVLKEVVLKNSKGKEIVEAILHIVRFFHHSPRYSTKLLKRTKLSVVSPGTTRWNSVIYALKRLLMVGFIDGVNEIIILARSEKPDKRTLPPVITPCMQEIMTELYKLLNPFIELSDALQSEGVTSSCIIPGIIGTYKAVAQLEINNEEMKRLQMNICLGLSERFGAGEEYNYRGRGARKQLLKVFDQKLYVLATLLDPRYKLTPFEVGLTEPYNMDKYRPTKELAMEILNQEFQKALSSEVVILNDQRTSTERSDLPHGSVFELFALESVPFNSPPVEQQIEISSYMSDPKPSLKSNPLLYWRQNESKYPNLARIARTALSVPASSGSVERVFSVAGAINRSRRSKLTLNNLDSLLITREAKLTMSSFRK